MRAIVAMSIKGNVGIHIGSCKGWCILENAASVAGMLLTTDCVLAEKKEEKASMPGGPDMGGMGGMM